jgi:hypothetical protein
MCAYSDHARLDEERCEIVKGIRTYLKIEIRDPLGLM